jgi:hypothetical protein
MRSYVPYLYLLLFLLVLGLCGGLAVFPFDFVRRGVLGGRVKLLHSLSTVPYAGSALQSHKTLYVSECSFMYVTF